MKKILILVASATKSSRTRALGLGISDALGEYSVETELIDLLELGLPTYDVTTEKTAGYDQKTQDFLDKSNTADGFVWVTPIYHNSYSSLLKTALDWQHFFMDGKVLGLASQGGDRSSAAMDQLLIVARAQHLVPIPTRVATDNADYDDAKRLTNEGIKSRIGRFAKEYNDFLERFSL